MTLSFKHTFTSSKSDGSDATLVQPSNWNQEHAVTAAVNKFLGTGASSTTVVELPCTVQGRSILAAADLATLLTALGAGAFTTGDVKPTYKITADTGWVMANDGSIGDASSGATARANADTVALFTLLYINVPGLVIQNSAGVTSSRVDAASDYAAHKRLIIPKTLGRALSVSGSGSGLTTRALGDTAGAQTATLAAGNLPSGVTISVSGGTGLLDNSSSLVAPPNGGTQGQAQAGTGSNNFYRAGDFGALPTSVINVTASGTLPGSSDPISIVPPETFMNIMIKL